MSDVATGSTVATFPGESSRKIGVAFSGDGRWMVTLAEPTDAGDLTAVVLDMSGEDVLVTRKGAIRAGLGELGIIPDQALVKAACITAGRDLTADEWRAMVDSAVPDDLACR
ncbi:RtcB family protein [Umezawaea endophytica]|uniref:RtcB family protein n=1 Tax=Umezawaea endophytica TaxID=1654476 RepID=A0A9X2VXL8_9PSEU|nr:RtcB family protein [Umezawaea endophytica]MCS7484564.1 RtcB family protein [Umezawaea endophytica]